MAYNVRVGETAESDILEIEIILFELSMSASDTFVEDLRHKLKLLEEQPQMYQEYSDYPKYRSIPLVYGYRAFYVVEQAIETITIVRVRSGRMDLMPQLENL